MAKGTRFRGVDSRGVNRSGPVGDQVGLWVFLRFDAGWQQLSVERDGIEVGRICRDEKGRRVWWAEAAGSVGAGEDGTVTP